MSIRPGQQSGVQLLLLLLHGVEQLGYQVIEGNLSKVFLLPLVTTSALLAVGIALGFVKRPDHDLAPDEDL